MSEPRGENATDESSSLAQTSSGATQTGQAFDKEFGSIGRPQNDEVLRTTRSREEAELSRHKTEQDDGEPRDAAHRTHTSSTFSRVETATKPPDFSFPREVAFIASILAAQLLTQAGLALSIAPLHVIGRSFGNPNPGELSWLTAGYSLTVGTFILPAGRWGDLYGHKKLYILGFAWYSAWSLIAGFSVWSHNLPFFAFCRAMQGIGPAILLPNGIAILARTYPPGTKKNMTLALFGAMAPGGFVIGAVFAGIWTQFVWWPWAYWFHGMGLIVVGLLAILVIPSMPICGEKPTLKELDLPGTFLGVSGLVLFNFAWNQGPVKNWQEVYVWVLLIVSVIVLVSFFFYEARWAAHPLLPTYAFTRDTLLVFGCLSAGWASFGTWVYYYWQFLEVIKGNSILLTTAKASPAAIAGATAAIVTGWLMGKVQPGYIMLCAMFAFFTGITLLATTPVDQTYWSQFFVSNIITCWGMDMSFPSGTIVLSNHMPPEVQGLAASLVNTVVNYSISIGLGIAGTVEVNVNDVGRNVLNGYRGAWYVGMGLDVLGMFLAVGLVISWRATMKARDKANAQEGKV